MEQRITFLGTCAADFSSKLENECKDCFDKNARRASSILIGKNILVDCGPHVLDSLRIADVPLSGIDRIFVTHLHGDHFQRESVVAIAKVRNTPLTLYVRRDAQVESIDNVRIVPMDEQMPYTCAAGVSATSLDANHDEKTFPQWLLFDMAGRKLLYATDGAWFLTKTYNFLKNADLDVLILDATCGDYTGDYRMAEHNSIPMIKLMLPSLKTAGIVSHKTQVYLSHIAPSLHSPHDEIEKQVSDCGLFVAYDGLSFYP